MEFDRKRFADNVKFFADMYYGGVSLLEFEVGVSRGYISRIAKEGGMIPNIEKVLKICKACHTPISEMLDLDMSKVLAADREAYKFLEDILRKTIHGEISWRAFSEKEMEQYRSGSSGPFQSLFKDNVYDGDKKYNEHAVFIDHSLYGSLAQEDKVLDMAIVKTALHKVVNYDIYLIKPKEQVFTPVTTTRKEILREPFMHRIKKIIEFSNKPMDTSKAPFLKWIAEAEVHEVEIPFDLDEEEDKD